MKKYGLVLSGGGAKGSYEIGVWKALQDLGIPITAITGTSIGALNGAMLVQGDYELVELAWTNFSVEQVIDIEQKKWEKEKIYEKHFSILTVIKNLITSDGMDLTPLKEALENYIDENKLRNSPIDFGLVTFSLTDFKPLQIFKNDIPKGQLVDYLVASACFPVFKPIEINNKKYIDGGFYDNVPIDLMASNNIKNIIVVDISGFVPKSRPDDDLNIINIKNSHDLGKTLEISPKKAKENIELGYLDTMKTFKILSGKTYYLTPYFTSNKKEPTVGNLSRKKIRKILGIEKNTPTPIKKLITSKFFKKIDEYMNIEIRTTTAICTAMSEITAELLGINPRIVYTLEDLNNVILKKLNIITASYEYISFVHKIEKLILKNNNTIRPPQELRSLIKENKKYLSIYLSIFHENHKNINNIRRYVAFTMPKITIVSLQLHLLIKEQNIKDEKLKYAISS